jgi:HAD superfamily hydrolase (TIGR01549 family)
VKTLIFDFDGTIADSFETILGIFEELHARPKKLTPGEIAMLRGEPIRKIMKYLKIRRILVPRLVVKAKRLLSVRMNDVHAFQYLPQIIRQLHRQGVPMYILSTNSQTNIEQFLKNNKLDGCFAKIYGNTGLFSKSSAIKKIVRRENLSRQECFYIGDEVRDIEAARNAKVTSVGVTWGFNNPQAIKSAKPDILVKKPKELLKI